MKTLLHICCAPCTIYPLQTLREEGDEVHGVFYNPNIHPYSEYRKRLDTLEDYAVHEGLPLIVADDYPMEDFLRNVVFREQDRCRQCYYNRVKYAAHIAKRGRFDRFTTTLLYSKFQNHELIRDIGRSIGKDVGIPFYYTDFREGWKAGVEESKKRGMYRQQYCGCIYSEKERFYKGAKRKEHPRNTS